MNRILNFPQLSFNKKTLIYLNQFIEPIINMTKYVINTSYILITRNTVSLTMNLMSRRTMLTMLRRNRRLDSSHLEGRGVVLCSLAC